MSEYDAVVIGAGHNGLTCACYLARAGMKVLVLEQYDKVGGMSITEEVTLAGFKSDIHAFGYQFGHLSPVPRELELSKYGFELIRPKYEFCHVFPNGDLMYMHRDVNKTAESIARYSRRDSETWRKMFSAYLEGKSQIVSFLNAPPLSFSEQAELIEKIPGGFELHRSTLQSYRSWCNEMFEADETKVFFSCWGAHAGFAPDDAGGAAIVSLFNLICQDQGNCAVKGGMMNLSLALARYLESRGGEIMTNTKVNKIIVRDGSAVAVRLQDGREIKVKKIVAASVHPQQLVLELLGDGQVDSDIIQKIKRYEVGDSVMTIYLALNGQVEFRAGGEPTRAGYIHPSDASLEYLSKVFAECRDGRLPSEPLIVIANEGGVDPSRAPQGKSVIKLLVLSVPYKIKSDATGKMGDREWGRVKEIYADYLVEILSERYMANIKSIALKRVVNSPIDLEERISSSVKGTIVHGAATPYQMGPMRPIPEMGRYKTPIKNLYICGSGSHPGPGISMMPGRNAAHVILEDLATS